MPGLLTVFKKELADHLGSRRFIIFFLVIVLASLSATYVATQSIATEIKATPTWGVPFVFLRLFTSSTGALPPFISFIAFFGPLLGLVLAFDAINREQTSGTMGLVLTQPLFRDSVINGKFLAGLATISIMLVSIVLVVSGLGLYVLGVPPTFDEALRIIAYLGVSIVYVAFWMALAMVFSIFFNRITTSALAGLGVWLFFMFFMSMIAGVIADRASPVRASAVTEAEFAQQEAQQMRHDRIQQQIMRISPGTLYEEATVTVLIPSLKTLGPVSQREVIWMLPGSLPLRQSLILVWPQLTALIALMLVCFAISYTKFMRQEIRAP